ncbi:MAG: 30S ribosomal protein S19 [Minisyncoccales bacterium]
MAQIESSKKQFRYRGKTLEELKQLDTREFARIINSRNRRTILRNFQEIENFLNRAREKMKKGKSIRTHKRDIVIVPAMIGMKISIYNGQKFIPVEITGEMLGHKFGEFAPSRPRINHGKAGVGATKGSKHKSKK